MWITSFLCTFLGVVVISIGGWQFSLKYVVILPLDGGVCSFLVYPP